VLACEPVDLNIVIERLNLQADQRFDLIVGTNIFLYYDAFEQMFALENAGATLNPGLLLTNDRLPEVPAAPCGRRASPTCATAIRTQAITTPWAGIRSDSEESPSTSGLSPSTEISAIH